MTRYCTLGDAYSKIQTALLCMVKGNTSNTQNVNTLFASAAYSSLQEVQRNILTAWLKVLLNTICEEVEV